MDITKRLMELDPTLELHNEGAWDKPFDKSSRAFASFNDAGIECETGEFLYSMIRILKPQEVLETGTHWGIGASYMGLALKDNNKGGLDTVEFLPENHERAKERIKAMGLEGWVRLHLQDVATFANGLTYGFILLDTEPQTRFAELIKFYDYLEPGGFIFIHDLHRHMAQVGQNPDHPEKFWPWGVLPEEIKDLVKTDRLRPFHFDTPRGLTGFYKPSPNDYKFF